MNNSVKFHLNPPLVASEELIFYFFLFVSFFAN